MYSMKIGFNLIQCLSVIRGYKTVLRSTRTTHCFNLKKAQVVLLGVPVQRTEEISKFKNT